MEYVRAFVVGGLLCAIGQIFIDVTKLTPARILVGYVVGGVILSAVGIYAPLVEFAGGGATVPLSGFGHLLAEGVKESVREKGLLGVMSGGISAASAGITAAMFFGLIAALICRPNAK
ncbi:MAG: stage V sporulation protein AE [Oscillospiraceae bacterium]|nr:stage V sporulation protein AE [Oscillospiraceae bacterium]